MIFSILRSVFKKNSQTNKLIEDKKNYREFELHVAGITRKNKDGSSRKEIAFSCYPGQKLLLVREPDNQHDNNAIKVMTEDGEQLGYIDSRNARDLQATLKGTSKTFSHIEAYFVEADMFETSDGKKRPYCRILIRRYYRNGDER